MRSRSEVVDMAKQEIISLWSSILTEHRKKLPHLCVHNHRQPLDFDKTREGEINPGYNRVNRVHLPMVPTMGLCMLGSEGGTWPGTICDEPLDAARCPVFTPATNPVALWVEFQNNLLNPKWVEENSPRLASLLWVLDSDTPSSLFRFPGWLGYLFRLFFPLKKKLPQQLPPKVAPEDLPPDFFPDGMGKYILRPPSRCGS